MYLAMSCACRVNADAASGCGRPGRGSKLSFSWPALSTVNCSSKILVGTPIPCQRAGDTFRLMIAQIWPASFTIGPPSDPGFTAAVLAAALKGRAAPIKAALLDQRVVAGLGNIYVCEALYRAAISPRRRAGTVQGARARRLHAAIGAVLREAIAAGGSTLRDHRRPDGELGYFQHSFAVYGREGEACPECVQPGSCAGIRRIVQSGRSTFYCATRQR